MRVLPLGDRGLLIEVGDALLPEINAQARALAVRLRDVPGVEEAVPTLCSVLVVFDPLGARESLVRVGAHFRPPLIRTATRRPASARTKIVAPPTVAGITIL